MPADLFVVMPHATKFCLALGEKAAEFGTEEWQIFHERNGKPEARTMDESAATASLNRILLFRAYMCITPCLALAFVKLEVRPRVELHSADAAI